MLYVIYSLKLFKIIFYIPYLVKSQKYILKFFSKVFYLEYLIQNLQNGI